MQTTEKQAHEAIKFNDCSIPSWHGQHLKRTTVLSATHIATVNAALTGIYAVVDVLHDREAQRSEGGQALIGFAQQGAGYGFYQLLV